MLRLLGFVCVLCLVGCLQPMQDPQAEKVDSQVQCGFGSSGC
uniref:OMP414 n=1 Tax=Helicobacter felis TaxID=214 RepID=A0A1M4NGF8_HELFE|nr:OMP414 [Helicobacter felis]